MCVQSIDLPMDGTTWRFWTMRQVNGCSRPAPRSSAVKQWFERRTRSKWSVAQSVEIVYCVCLNVEPYPRLLGWPFWGQISEIWSQITLAGPKIFVWPFCRIDLAPAKIKIWPTWVLSQKPYFFTVLTQLIANFHQIPESWRFSIRKFHLSRIVDLSQFWVYGYTWKWSCCVTIFCYAVEL